MQQSLTFTKGITNNPSDQLSSDSELAESVGIIYRDGEMHPIQSVPTIAHIPYKVVFVHKMADYDNIITYSDNDNRIYCYKRVGNDITIIDDNSFLVGELRSVEAVGNTLVVSTDEGLHYFLYKAGEYVDLGTSLPDVTVTPMFSARTTAVNSVIPYCNITDMYKRTVWKAYYKNDELVTVSDAQPDEGTYDNASDYLKVDFSDDYNKYQSMQTAIQGHVALVINNTKQDNHFLFPFFLRYALRLYDGSYAKISAPIACFPTISRNFSMFPASYSNNTWMLDAFFQNKTTDLWICLLANSTLYCETTLQNADNWADIVKEVVVFASDDVMPFYIDKTYSFKRASEVNHTPWANFIASRHLSGQHTSTDGTVIYNDSIYNYHFSYSEATQQACDVIQPEFKSEQDIIDELLTKTQFYKLFSIQTSDSKYIGSGFIKAPIKNNVLENLTVQEQLPKDDYYGWTKLIATSLFSYNKRLNIIGTNRYPFKGFNTFADQSELSESTANGRNVRFYVHIVSDTMDAWVSTDEQWTDQDTLNSWFFYPDPNATELIIWFIDSKKGARLALKRHDMLNGAYAFQRLPLDNTFTTDSSISLPSVDTSAHETLDSQIFTSVVNNPYLFEASGDNTVGTGSILAVTSNTEPVSTGQFGQYPLIVFTTEGIYGMSVNSEGLYAASYPISRDVCNNASSVTPTDNAVFFTTDKGLMAITGGQATLVSPQLSGHVSATFSTIADCDFTSYLSSCLIAYDYRNALLHIYGKDKAYHWVYSLTNKTFAICNDGYTIISAVQSYPDFIIQDSNEGVYSFSAIPLPTEDNTIYAGTFTTRPLKLEGSLIRKSLQRIRHIFDSANGSVQLAIYASDDARHWIRLTSLHGKPWKFFVFQYSFTGFRAIDAYSAAVIDYQPRTNFH